MLLLRYSCWCVVFSGATLSILPGAALFFNQRHSQMPLGGSVYCSCFIAWPRQGCKWGSESSNWGIIHHNGKKWFRWISHILTYNYISNVIVSYISSPHIHFFLYMYSYFSYNFHMIDYVWIITMTAIIYSYSIYLGSYFIILHQFEFEKKNVFLYDSLGTPSLSQTLAHGV